MPGPILNCARETHRIEPSSSSRPTNGDPCRRARPATFAWTSTAARVAGRVCPSPCVRTPGLHDRPRRGRAGRSPRRSGSRPVAAACPRRSVMFTVSPVTNRWPSAGIACDHLARVHPDPDGEVDAVRLPRARGSARDGRVASPRPPGRRAARRPRGRRNAEHGHDGVADELLDRTAVALDDGSRRSK